MNPTLLLQLVAVAIVLALGFWYFRQPKKVIKAQQDFYLLFNWKLEPVSMKKEIQNTRFMGKLLMVLAVISFICIIFRR